VSPPARLLDLTRLTSRAGRVLTGVDRVERAYLQELLRREAPVFGLVRTAVGYVLLDRSGMAAIDRALTTGDWGAPDRIAQLARLDPDRGAAQALSRSHAAARCLPPGLGRMLRRHLPTGTAYLNVGHSNLTARVLGAVRALPGARISVLVHDVIPLDHPEWQRDGTVAQFAGKIARVSAMADLVICTTPSTQADITRHLTQAGRAPGMITTALGVTPAVPAPGDLPPDIGLSQPYFVAVGTIEPRKNLTLLLDTWDLLGPAAPMLFIAGGGGWKNDHIMARLGATPRVRQLPGMSDGAVAALLLNARALLFPSLAEGFGLPVAEALALGTPVVCAPLPLWPEIAGDRPVYADGKDAYLWARIVTDMTQTRHRPAPYDPPQWDAHFKAVLSVT
jgi:glycosyltransferase involved in cell wall biosynthesis